MSIAPDPSDPPSLSPNSPISTSKALVSSSVPIMDPFDTPLFNRLIGLIEELNITVKEQRKALEEQTVIASEQRKALEKQNAFGKEQSLVLERQREVMEDMKNALIGHRSTSGAVANVGKEDDDTRAEAETVSDPNVDTTANHQTSTSADPGSSPTALPSKTGINSSRNEAPAETSKAVEQTVGETSTQIQPGEPTVSALPDSRPDHIHRAILSLNDTMKSVKETLLAHGSKLDVLIRDALEDGKPYDQKPLEDESTCTALLEIAMARTKEEVDEWIKRMDVSLVFIALFSAVLTAFVVPATQNLFPSNNSPGNPTDSPPPEPNVSAQDVCILYYLALILAIIDAVLSVLGRQWMSKLTNKPIGSTYKERLLRHIAREELAKRWLQYLVEGLHILLLWSIGLFMTGLLYQIFNLSGSFERSSPRILAAGVVGVVLSSGILVVVLAATTHALVYEASPFGGPFSKVLFKLTSVMSVLFKRLMDVLDEMAYRVDQPCGRIRFYRILPVVGKVVAWPLWFCSMLVDSWRIELDEDDREKLIGAFMELTAEASDPKLLERAVGSFSYVEWSATGGESQESEDQLKKTWNRLSSTDTSVRVHETLREWVLPFVKYCVEHNKKIGEDIMDSIFRTYPMPTRFPAEVLFASFYTRNPDLRHLAALPSEECIAGVLCSYNLEGRLQGWQDVFNLAQAYCEYLLIMRKGDDVTRILSHVDRLDLIKSYIRYPGYIDFSLVEFTVEGHKHEILSTINQFIKTVDQSRLSPRSFADVFIILADPPPSDIDLSPIIDYLSQHPHNYTWERTSETVIAYLNSFGVSKITYHAALRRFLQQCLDLELRHPFERGMIRASDETRDRARVLLSEPSLSFPES